MTNNKKQNLTKVELYKQNKEEIAEELGINGYESTEVNVKLASQGEAKYSKKTMNRKSHIKNGKGDFKGRMDI
ncbi:hypothetical protein GCM10008904_31600 [Paraclostridium ghonii]|uniref:Small, acid-soluble spore protein, alpha/beta type n=1 Tax=Paraclostridium ghonii TaxID=29358 RepID=A0ABU0MWZ8_9FIRM|nr:hypothetical protein [Paeniclostridium ghonii]MDQ0555436.1 hypothetical protein [Paeniclostridium ghonii]